MDERSSLTSSTSLLKKGCKKEILRDMEDPEDHAIELINIPATRKGIHKIKFLECKKVLKITFNFKYSKL